MSDSFSWAVDPTLRVDRIHVIESLPEDEQGWYARTGARLFEELQDIWARTPVVPHLHVIHRRDELSDLLRRLVGEASEGHFPLLHFETHGIDREPGPTTTSAGLSLGSHEEVRWRDLAPFLAAINEATKLNLIVFMSACYGLDVATLVQPLEPAPVRVLIGPMRKIRIPDIDKAVPAFYRSLFRDRDGAAAFNEMNRALPDGPAFLVMTAEKMFLDILLGYYNEMTTDEAVEERVEGIIRHRVAAGASPQAANAGREWMRAMLRDRRRVFDEAYRRFFFIDKHPEIAERFQMTYEGCFQEARL
jgi:hypothetical protein